MGFYKRAENMAASLSVMALRRLAPKILRNSAVAKVTSSSFSTSPSSLISSSTPSLAPVVQKPAPAFKAQAVVDGQFKEVSLSDYAGKYVVVYFYPLDFTFVCPTEIIAFSDRIQEFKDIDCEVVGISTDSHFSHLAWVSQPRKQGGLGGLNYPLVSDFNKQISRDYGVLIEEAGIALRGLFIVDPSGVLRFCFLLFFISNKSQPSKGLIKCVHVTGKCQSTTCQSAEVWMKLFV